MPDLARILTVDRSLSAAITRREHPKHRPHGHRDRVDGQIVRDIAWPRLFVWRAFLRQRIPTKVSIHLAAARMRGIALLRATLVARVTGQPDPTGYTPPAWAVPFLPPQTVTRADDPNPPPDPQQSDQIDAAWANIDDALASQDVTDGVAADAPVPLLSPQDQRAIAAGNALAQVSSSLSFDQWLPGALNDLQVMQILDAHWNGQAALFARDEQLTPFLSGSKAAGITGTFDMEDPYTLAFMQNLSGYYIRGIDQANRDQISRLLWEGYGGTESLSVDALARKLYQGMQGSGMDLSLARANLIATTETARAETFGQFVGLLQLGARQKRWVVSAGACNRCLTNSEVGNIPIFNEFPLGGLSPPDHPLCRCSLSMEVSGDFNPDEWTGGPDATWFDSLMMQDGMEQWPHVDLSGMGLSWDYASPPPVPPIPGGTLIGHDDLPSALAAILTPDVLGALGARFGTFADDVAAQALPDGTPMTTAAGLAAANDALGESAMGRYSSQFEQGMLDILGQFSDDYGLE